MTGVWFIAHMVDNRFYQHCLVFRLHLAFFRLNERSLPRDGADEGEGQSESIHLVPRAVRLQEGAGCLMGRCLL